MGNTAGNVVFEFDEGIHVYPGAKLQGRLILKVSDEINADCLLVSFVGLEKTHHSDGESNEAYDQAAIYSSTFILKTFEGSSVAEGCYTFPFEVIIPRGLPRSYDRFNRSISYYIAAELRRDGKLAGNVKGYRVLPMNEEPSRSLPTQPTRFRSVTSKVTFLCLNSRGTITFGGMVNSTNLCTTEKLRLNFEICNESTSRVKSVDICITRYEDYRVRMITYKGIPRLVYCMRVDPLNMAGANPLRKNGHGVVDRNAILKLIDEGKYHFGVYVPITGIRLSSYSGKLITIRYELTMTVVTTFGTTNSSINLPMTFACAVPEVVGVPAAVLNPSEIYST
jgi:hypothetical protein